MRKGLVVFLIVLAAAAGIMSGTGCANIVPPTGGPRDTLPPRLLHASPPDSTVNFTGREITLNFDEFVDVKDVSNNLLYAPNFRNTPLVQARKRTVTVKIRDSLLPNTTYVINFGNAIVDLNEGNPLRDYTYVFSTGPVLDSLTISGRVQLAEDASTDSTLIAVLHKSLNDSAVVNQSPLYVARVDRNGRFRFRNLPADTFAVYILGNAGFSKRYQNKSDLFAFANSPVVAGKADSLRLYAYREQQPNSNAATGAGGQRISPNDHRLRLTPNTQPQDLMTDYILGFPVPLRNFDSTKVHLTSDSSFSPVSYSLSLDTSRREMRIRSAWKQNTKYNLVLDKDFASDTSGRQLLKTDTLFFSTRKESDYGKLVLRVTGMDTARNPVLLFVQNNKAVFSAPIRSGHFEQELFPPGDYELRILYDTNNNGRWDPGHFFGVKRQPELVYPISEKITVKPNWENEFDRRL